MSDNKIKLKGSLIRKVSIYSYIILRSVIKSILRELGLSRKSTDELILDFEAASLLKDLKIGSKKKKIKKIPGSSLSKMFKFLLPKKIYELFIEPKIADEVEEYIEALDNKEFYKAKYIKFRVWIVVFYSVALILPSRVVKVVKAIVGK
jgi:hypothetical protein